MGQALVGILLLLLLSSTDAFLLNANLPHKTSRLHKSSANDHPHDNTCNPKIALLLPSDPPNPILQNSAAQIVDQLTVGAAVVVTCNTREADVAYEASAVIALGVEAPLDVRFVATAFRQRRSVGTEATCQFALGGKPFAPLLGAYDEANPTWQQDVPWTAAGQDKTLLRQMQALFEKGEIEDYVEAIELYLKTKGN